jgi:hypothetical protein
MTKKVNKLIPDTEYETVIQRFEELHAMRREHEKRLRLIERVENQYNSLHEPNNSGYAPNQIDNIIKKCTQNKLNLTLLLEKENNPYAESGIKHADNMLSLLKRIEKLQNSLNKYNDEKEKARKAYETYLSESRAVQRGMRPESVSDGKFQDMLHKQWSDYCKLDEPTQIETSQGRTTIRSDIDGEKYIKQAKPLIETLEKEMQEYKENNKTYLYDETTSDIRRKLASVHALLDNEWYNNQDLIMKHRYPQTDIVQHYASCNLGTSRYLTKGDYEGSSSSRFGIVPIGEWQ